MGSFRIKVLVNERGGYKWAVGLLLSSVLKLHWSRQLACWLGGGGVYAVLYLWSVLVLWACGWLLSLVVLLLLLSGMFWLHFLFCLFVAYLRVFFVNCLEWGVLILILFRSSCCLGLLWGYLLFLSILGLIWGYFWYCPGVMY